MNWSPHPWIDLWAFQGLAYCPIHLPDPHPPSPEVQPSGSPWCSSSLPRLCLCCSSHQEHSPSVAQIRTAPPFLPLPGGLRQPEPLPSNGLTSPPLLSTQGRWCLCLTSFLFLQPLPGLPDSSLVPSDVSWQVVLQLKLSSPTPGALPPEHDHKHRPGLCPRVLNFRAQVFK